jgi:hypothetical protein
MPSLAGSNGTVPLGPVCDSAEAGGGLAAAGSGVAAALLRIALIESSVCAWRY